MKSKSILILFQPHRQYSGSLLEMLVESIITTDLNVKYVDITNLPDYRYSSLKDKFQNIFHRHVFNNKQYILKLEADFYNEFYLKKVKEFKSKNDEKFDYVLIIKPEEFTPKVIKEVVSMGEVSAGYIWDGLRLFFKPNLIKNKKYIDYIYSFDTNNIKDHPELNLEFSTNFAVFNQKIVPYDQRKIDLFYVGDLAGRLDTQRRDTKLIRLLQHVDGNFDVNILFKETDKSLQRYDSHRIKYIETFIPMAESLERTRNSKIVIDICKAHHIGLSFRFFECMATETKIITNNKDVVNYDFYNPNNIMLVDFDHDILEQHQFDEFLSLPYQSLNYSVLEKYSVQNWIQHLFKSRNHIPIKK